MRKRCPIHLYVCAANFELGKIGILTAENQSEDVVLVSACVQTLFQAVIIDGEPRWDGGYMDKPVIYPLIYTANSVLSPTVHRLRAFGLLQQSGWLYLLLLPVLSRAVNAGRSKSCVQRG